MRSRASAFVVLVVIAGCSPKIGVRPPEPGHDAGTSEPGWPDDAGPTGVEHDAGPGASDSSWYVDSDGDGVADAVEVHAGTDPRDGSESPRTRGDFFFVVPYESDPEPPRDTMVFGTAIQRADVHFMIDTSISMQHYIHGIRYALTSHIIPGVAAAIPDVWLGVGQFDVCPTSGFRPGICRGITMDARSTGDAVAVTAALDTLTADCAPVNEPYAQAAWLWATGDTSRFPGMSASSCAAGTIGLGCVRGDALPILVVVGDEGFAESYRTATSACEDGRCAACARFPSSSDIISAFAAIRGRLVVLGPTGTSPEWGPIVTATGAVDESGRPLIFPDAGVSTTVDGAVVDALARLAASTPLDVSARAVDLDDDGIDATVFVERIEPNVTGGVADRRDPSRVCVGGLPTADADGDGRAETFPRVRPGTPVCFDIVVRRNGSVPPAAEPRIVRGAIEVVGDGVTVLDRRTVYFLVPAESGGPILI